MKIGLVCSHGGHLTEVLQILQAFEGHEIFFATYHSARDREIGRIAPAHFTNNIGTSPLRRVADIAILNATGYNLGYEQAGRGFPV